jgi:C1q domain.
MKKLLFLASLLIPELLSAAGPKFRHKEAEKQMEFDNLYQDIRSVAIVSSATLPSGSTQYIQNSATLQSGAVFYVSSGTVEGSAAGDGAIISYVRNTGTGYATKLVTNSAGGAYLLISGLGTGASGNKGGILNADTSLVEGGGGHTMFVTASAGQLVINTETAVPILLRTNNTIVSSFTAAGEILQPLQPSFEVRLSSSPLNVTGDGDNFTITFNTEIYDRGGDFNSGTYTFTAPIAGVYHFDVHAHYGGASAVTDGEITLVTTSRTYKDQFVNTTELFGSLKLSESTSMAANDTALVRIAVSGGTQVTDVRESDAGGIYTYFSGYLVH